MAFEILKSQIEQLLDQARLDTSDPHVVQERLREQLSELAALGLPLPQDLVDLEAALEDPQALARFAAARPASRRDGADS